MVAAGSARRNEFKRRPRPLRFVSVHRHHGKPSLGLATIWGVVGIGTVGLLGQWGVVTRHPLSVLVAVAGCTGVLIFAGNRLFELTPTAAGMHARIASHAVVVTMWIFMLGWGPALAVGYVFVILPDALRIGSRARWAVAVWPIVCLGAGQLVIAAAGIDSALPVRTGNG
ncbi:MAG TPA: hypothetical protein VE197_17630, partial [Mycobacterium sp.]|nr:hypothetical protein [Mycobacterium sp.]